MVIRDDDKISPELQNAVENEVKRLIKVKLLLIGGFHHDVHTWEHLHKIISLFALIYIFQTVVGP